MDQRAVSDLQYDFLQVLDGITLLSNALYFASVAISAAWVWHAVAMVSVGISLHNNGPLEAIPLMLDFHGNTNMMTRIKITMLSESLYSLKSAINSLHYCSKTNQYHEPYNSGLKFFRPTRPLCIPSQQDNALSHRGKHSLRQTRPYHLPAQTASFLRHISWREDSPFDT